MKTTRRQAIAGIATIPAGLILLKPANGAPTTPTLIAPPSGPAPTLAQTFGAPGAPTIEEFFAWNCPHCAHFFLKTFPDLKTQFIDTREIRWFSTPVVADETSMTASLIARALNQDDYTAYAKALFIQQDTWTGAKNPIDAVLAIAIKIGIPPGVINKARKDQAAREVILEQTYRAAAIPIHGTPSFQMNGKIVEGDLGLGHLSYEFGLNLLKPIPETNTTQAGQFTPIPNRPQNLK